MVAEPVVMELLPVQLAQPVSDIVFVEHTEGVKKPEESPPRRYPAETLDFAGQVDPYINYKSLFLILPHALTYLLAS